VFDYVHVWQSNNAKMRLVQLVISLSGIRVSDLSGQVEYRYCYSYSFLLCSDCIIYVVITGSLELSLSFPTAGMKSNFFNEDDSVVLLLLFQHSRLYHILIFDQATQTN